MHRELRLNIFLFSRIFPDTQARMVFWLQSPGLLEKEKHLRTHIHRAHLTMVEARLACSRFNR